MTNWHVINECLNFVWDKFFWLIIKINLPSVLPQLQERWQQWQPPLLFIRWSVQSPTADVAWSHQSLSHHDPSLILNASHVSASDRSYVRKGLFAQRTDQSSSVFQQAGDRLDETREDYLAKMSTPRQFFYQPAAILYREIEKNPKVNIPAVSELPDNVRQFMLFGSMNFKYLGGSKICNQLMYTQSVAFF